ncbi:hypothetical protein [Fusibacter ferrireducens]|uniref:DUF5518 domain-containing protein n=1 Tax=Fusibacter ferrireducens TaxID=2785058 RepID=A0ABR9ZVU7_9FIRM|nr:hypothetical protein [Fusibacter ferrireducens]MBF4694582.1 hypothetical protein [Fusibacter ferrireducens]
MLFSLITMAIIGKLLHDKGYEIEKLIPAVLIGGLIAYFIPIGAIIAWPFNVVFGIIGGLIGHIGGLIGSIVGGIGGAFGGVVGGVGGIIGTILGIVFGIIGVIIGIIGAVIGLAVGLIGLILSLIFVFIIPAIILFIIIKVIRSGEKISSDRR